MIMMVLTYLIYLKRPMSYLMVSLMLRFPTMKLKMMRIMQ